MQEEQRKTKKQEIEAQEAASTAAGKPAARREAEEENPLGTAPVHGLLVKLSVPLMLSMLMQSLYNIVDSIFVSRISEDALTAVSLCFPVQSLMVAFGIGTAVGMSALMSRFLGAGQFERVNRIAQNGVFLAICTYLLFALIGLFARPFIAVQTSDPEIVEYGTQYLSIVCWLSFMLMLQLTFERLLQSTGKTFYIFVTQSVGAVINVIMDPILIFGLLGAPQLGVAGAAIATVFGQCVAALMGIWFNAHRNTEVRLRFHGFRPSWADIREIYRIGIPSIILQSVGSVMVFGMNQILVHFSTTAVATFGAYFKIQSFVFMPVFGMSNGVVPVIAYNYGARKRGRMEKAMAISVRYSVGFMLCGAIIFWAAPGFLLSLFDASATMLEIGRVALRVIALSFPAAGYAIMRGSVFQALGKSTYSMNISLVRQLGVLLPVAFLLAQTGQVNAVWLAWPIAEVAGISMSVHYTRKIRREIIAKI